MATPVTKRSWYDCLREHRPREKEALVEIHPRTLLTNFRCPICLDVVKKTLVTKQCVHRFCASCITKVLRAGRKACPTCRTALPSARHLQEDPTFDALIAAIFKGANSKHRAEVVPKQLTTKHEESASEVEEPLGEEKEEVKARKIEILKEKVASMQAPAINAPTPVVLRPNGSMVGRVALPPEALKTRYFCTRENDPTVEHVARFLLTRIRMDCYNSPNPDTRKNVDKLLYDKIYHTELFMSDGRKLVSLDFERRTGIQELVSKIGSQRRPIVLYYLLYDSSVYAGRKVTPLSRICPPGPTVA